ncbi:MAG: amidohydrolase [Bacteroidota bacterium]
MKEQISVCQVQPDMHWEDVNANLENLDKLLMEIPPGTDLIMLPETFSTGFTMQSDRFAEEVDGNTVSWMKKIASEKQVHITGSVIIREDGRIYNRLFWISPKGIEGHYDKRHLFRMGREDENFNPGKSRAIFTLGSFRFMPQICYDLRFPVFSRNQGDYDVLYYVANWPAPRQQVWETLLPARAMENQAYVLGVNRVGRDGLGVDHAGGTCACDPLGNVIHRLDHKPGIQACTLDMDKIRELRKKFPVWKDADRFSID